jgi:hypothetical protein
MRGLYPRTEVPPLSRKMGFEELVSVLVGEHQQMKAKLAEVRGAVANLDFSGASKALNDLKAVFKQHIADEEAQVLRLLIETHGVKGSEDAIVVFRQHRPIYELMEKVNKLASLSPEELESDQMALKALLESHTVAEEARIFPTALDAHRHRKTDVDAANS